MILTTLIKGLQADLAFYGDLEVWLRISHKKEEMQAKLEGRVIKMRTRTEVEGVLLSGGMRTPEGKTNPKEAE